MQQSVATTTVVLLALLATAACATHSFVVDYDEQQQQQQQQPSMATSEQDYYEQSNDADDDVDTSFAERGPNWLSRTSDKLGGMWSRVAGTSHKANVPAPLKRFEVNAPRSEIASRAHWDSKQFRAEHAHGHLHVFNEAPCAAAHGHCVTTRTAHAGCSLRTGLCPRQASHVRCCIGVKTYDACARANGECVDARVRHACAGGGRLVSGKCGKKASIKCCVGGSRKHHARAGKKVDANHSIHPDTQYGNRAVALAHTPEKCGAKGSLRKHWPWLEHIDDVHKFTARVAKAVVKRAPWMATVLEWAPRMFPKGERLELLKGGFRSGTQMKSISCARSTSRWSMGSFPLKESSNYFYACAAGVVSFMVSDCLSKFYIPNSLFASFATSIPIGAVGSLSATAVSFNGGMTHTAWALWDGSSGSDEELHVTTHPHVWAKLSNANLVHWFWANSPLKCLKVSMSLQVSVELPHMDDLQRFPASHPALKVIARGDGSFSFALPRPNGLSPWGLMSLNLGRVHLFLQTGGGGAEGVAGKLLVGGRFRPLENQDAKAHWLNSHLPFPLDVGVDVQSYLSFREGGRQAGFGLRTVSTLLGCSGVAELKVRQRDYFLGSLWADAFFELKVAEIGAKGRAIAKAFEASIGRAARVYARVQRLIAAAKTRQQHHLRSMQKHDRDFSSRCAHKCTVRGHRHCKHSDPCRQKHTWHRWTCELGRQTMCGYDMVTEGACDGGCAVIGSYHRLREELVRVYTVLLTMGDGLLRYMSAHLFGTESPPADLGARLLACVPTLRRVFLRGKLGYDKTGSRLAFSASVTYEKGALTAARATAHTVGFGVSIKWSFWTFVKHFFAHVLKDAGLALTAGWSTIKKTIRHLEEGVRMIVGKMREAENYHDRRVAHYEHKFGATAGDY